jgi:hypothetical protein
MGSQHFENNEAVQKTMHTWLQITETEFYHSYIFRLMQQWQKFLDCSVDSVE